VTVAAHLFVDDLEQPEVAEVDRHHVERVLRLRPGEAVTVSDGRGGVRRCAFVSGGSLEATAEVEWAPRPDPALGVGFAIVKGDRPDWIVQKLTECGVDRILPFVAGRSIVRWDGDKEARHAERWSTIAREAAMQSRQAWLPAVAPVRAFREVVTAEGAGVALADVDGRPPTLRAPVVLVGPEGGWTPEERAEVAHHVRLGASTLRSDTAAVGVGILLMALRGGTVLDVHR
jgi:16S rRNA (uracil1498-N3)-methyltransferase